MDYNTPGARESLTRKDAFGERIAKCYVYLKKKGETDYWLDVIHSAGYFSDEEYASLDADNKELLRMLAAIVKTSKEKE